MQSPMRITAICNYFRNIFFLSVIHLEELTNINLSSRVNGCMIQLYQILPTLWGPIIIYFMLQRRRNFQKHFIIIIFFAKIG